MLGKGEIVKREKKGERECERKNRERKERM